MRSWYMIISYRPTCYCGKHSSLTYSVCRRTPLYDSNNATIFNGSLYPIRSMSKPASVWPNRLNPISVCHSDSRRLWGKLQGLFLILVISCYEMECRLWGCDVTETVLDIIFCYWLLPFCYLLLRSWSAEDVSRNQCRPHSSNCDQQIAWCCQTAATQ